MRRYLLLLALAALPAPAFAGGAAPAAGAAAIHRGGSGNGPSAVPVYRGSAAAPARRLAEAVPMPEAIVGGRNVWLVQHGEGKLTVCRVVRTTTIGRERIRCASGRLPAD
ncbi:hypothetical protein [Benzoatithermus flavus]|uniref:Uncharacterized protein n=1 Tax=Benzoatithermus flavus TaxID=3108223 RepID=A0ABU8XQW5_9PROT